MLYTNEISLNENNSTEQIASAHETSKVMIYEHPLFGKVRMFVENGKGWFCANDIATSLAYENPQKAIRDHCKEHGVTIRSGVVKTGLKKDGTVYEQIGNMKFISEGNIYRLTAKSQMPKADEFESWIFDDIVPSVINTGSYSLQSQLPDFSNPAEAARAWADQYERNKVLELEVKQQNETVELQQKELAQAAPKVNYYDEHLQSINTLTTTQVAKQISLDAQKLNKKLKEIGVLYKQSGQWILRHPYSTFGLHAVRTQTFTRSDGSIGTNTYTVWTTKGVRFVIALYENDWNVKKAKALIESN